MKPDLTAHNINAKPAPTPPARLTEVAPSQGRSSTSTISVRNCQTTAKAEARA